VALDADLVAYYEAEARGRHRVAHGEFRSGLVRRFAAMLDRERRLRVADIGAGPGLDAVALQAEGFHVVGVDLAYGNVARMVDGGLAALTGSLYQLPFAAGTFDALWTMSTLVHVPDVRFDDALIEMLRVVRPGAPLGIGTWGGFDFEGIPEFGALRPYRFFSLASHQRWHSMLSRHGQLEVFEIHDPGDEHGWQYQFAVLRAPSRAPMG
jgi:SAM-dependent methyltransferase